MTNEATGSVTSENKDSVAPPTGPGQVEKTPAELESEATKLVERYSLFSGAGGLIPLPVVDVAVVSGIQFEMLRKLAKMYNVPFSEDWGKSVLASLLGSIVPASSGLGVASALKSIPVFGTAVGILTMSGAATGATYLIGRIFIQHFATGGTLLDFNPPDYHEFIKSTKEKMKMRSGTSSSAPDSSISAPSKAPAGS